MKDREIASLVLRKITEEGAYANQELARALVGTDDKTARLVRRIVYGCLDHLNSVDQLIDETNRSKRKRLDPTIRSILRISVYQLLYTDQIPAHAILHDAVEMAKAVHPRYGGFVNGILRTVSRKEKAPEGDRFPEPIRIALTADYTESEIRALRSSVKEIPYLCIRRNPLGVSAEELADQFHKLGMELIPSGITEGVFRVIRPKEIIRTDMYAQGWFSVQDEAAASVVPFGNPKPGESWLDLCAAPGGKSTQLAESIKDRGEIIACDLYPQKVKKIEEHAKRLGLLSIRTRVQDATEFCSEFISRFDGVLLDAPCSGLGLLRRKPDIQWHRTAEQFEEVQMLQKKMLECASKYVKPGGTLLYSTCTILSAENRKQIDRFLGNHPEFLLEEDHTTDMISSGADGFYMARLKRKSS